MPLELNGASAEVTAPILAALRGAGRTIPNTYPERQTFQSVALGALTIADGASMQWNLAAGSLAACTITDDRSIELLNLQPGVYRLRVTQGSGGGHGIAFTGATVRTPGGDPIALSAAEGAVDWLTLTAFGTGTVDVTAALDFQAL